MEMITIPKEYLLCDCCNKQLTDTRFNMLEDSAWYGGYLCCHECEHKYGFAGGEMELVAKYQKGDNVSKTRLANPATILGF